MTPSVSPLTQHRIKSFQEFRAGLISLKKADLSQQVLSDYWHRNTTKLAGIAGGTHNQIGYLLNSLQVVDDVDVLDSARDEFLKIIDDCLVGMTAQGQVRPLLDDFILKVKDTKLSTLLKEFNAIKDHQPNLAAIGIRTIICLIIQERAKLTDPTGRLATTQDLALDPMLSKALGQGVFPEGESKLLHAFQSRGQKVMFDNIVHKSGENMLIAKDDLSAAVDLLNKLLPTLALP